MGFVLTGLLQAINPAQAQQAKQQVSNDPYSSFRLHDDEERQCGGFDNCDQGVIEQLKKECLLDGGTVSWPPNAGSSW